MTAVLEGGWCWCEHQEALGFTVMKVWCNMRQVVFPSLHLCCFSLRFLGLAMQNIRPPGQGQGRLPPKCLQSDATKQLFRFVRKPSSLLIKEKC